MIIKKLSIFIFSILLLPSCNKTPDFGQVDLFPQDGVSLLSINHDGSSRNYWLYIPPSYNGRDALPVVFNFHNSNENALDYLFNTSDMRSIASREHEPFFLVYPEAGFCNKKTTWNSSGQGGGCFDDLDFIDTLIDSLSSNFKIDESKIYACGFSEGGSMAMSLGVSKSNRFAAVGSVSGTMLNFNTPLNPMPTIIVHGIDDDVFPYLGNTVNNSIQSQLDFWVDFNNTNTVPLVTGVTNNNSNIFPAERYQYLQGDNNVAVEHIKIIGGLHRWRLDQNIYPAGSSADDDTGLLLWNFFRNYSN